MSVKIFLKKLGENLTKRWPKSQKGVLKTRYDQKSIRY